MPVQASLHWLPVLYRIPYKISLFVFKTLYDLTSRYISENLSSYRTAWSLRSTDQRLFPPPRRKTFLLAALKLSNSQLEAEFIYL